MTWLRVLIFFLNEKSPAQTKKILYFYWLSLDITFKCRRNDICRWVLGKCSTNFFFRNGPKIHVLLHSETDKVVYDIHMFGKASALHFLKLFICSTHHPFYFASSRKNFLNYNVGSDSRSWRHFVKCFSWNLQRLEYFQSVAVLRGIEVWGMH